MNRTRVIVSIIIASLAMLLTACETPKWNDPSYMNKKLMDEDKATRSLAMSNLDQLKKEDYPKIVPGLLNIYNKDEILKRDAMKELLQLKSPEAKDAYIQELKTNQTDYATGAAYALGTLGDTSVDKDLLEVYNSTDKDDVKVAILRAFLELPSGVLVPDMIKTLKLDVERRPIALLAYSCAVLSKVAIIDPKSISDEDVKQITLAMFFANRMNQSLGQDCGMTVQALGERAVPELVKIFKGEREDVKNLFLKYDTSDSPYPPNLAKVVATQRLTSLRAKEIVPLAMEDLVATKVTPKEYNPSAAQSWQMKEAQASSEELYALGDLRAEDAIPLLESIMKGEKFDKEYKEITDALIELQLRQDASAALLHLGNRSSLPAMLEVVKSGVIQDFEKLALAKIKRGVPVKDLERYQMNWIIAQNYADLALPENRADFEAVIESKRASAPDLAKKLEEMLVMFDVAKECLSKPDAKAQAGCFGDKIVTSDNSLVREKAAWEIGRFPKEIAAPLINKALVPKNLAAREILEFQLYRLGDADTVKTIDKILENEKDAGSDYALDHYRLNLVRLYLLTHGIGKP